MDPITVTIPDAGKALGLGKTRIYELIAEGRLESIRLGGRRLVKVASIRRLVEEASEA